MYLRASASARQRRQRRAALRRARGATLGVHRVAQRAARPVPAAFARGCRARRRPSRARRPLRWPWRAQLQARTLRWLRRRPAWPWPRSAARPRAGTSGTPSGASSGCIWRRPLQGRGARSDATRSCQLPPAARLRRAAAHARPLLAIRILRMGRVPPCAATQSAYSLGTLPILGAAKPERGGAASAARRRGRGGADDGAAPARVDGVRNAVAAKRRSGPRLSASSRRSAAGRRTVPSSPRTRAGGLALLVLGAKPEQRPWRGRGLCAFGAAAKGTVSDRLASPQRRTMQTLAHHSASYHTAGRCTELPQHCRLGILGLQRLDGVNVLLHRSLLGHACARGAATASARVTTSARGGSSRQVERHDSLQRAAAIKGARALVGGPGVPLGLALHVQEARARCAARRA